MKPQSIPEAHSGTYRTLAADQPILLHEGPLRVFVDGHALDGTGRIEFVWRPFPGPVACVTALDADGVVARSTRGSPSVALALDGERFNVALSDFSISGVRPPFEVELELRLRDDREMETDHPTTIGFHVVNFVDYVGDTIGVEGRMWRGRLVLGNSTWRVTIDRVGHFEDVMQSLKRRGGYAITHVGVLERQDGGAFTATDAQGVFGALFNLLSFIKGAWCPIVLPVGRNAASETCSERWHVPKADEWSDRVSWFFGQRPEFADQVFRALTAHWHDDQWRKALQLAVSWYVHVAEENSPDVGVVLGLAGLELLSWFRLVEVEALVPPEKFNNKRSDQRTRKLLTRSGIPVVIPSGLNALREESSRRGWKDGPDAIKSLRDAAVHPGRRDEVFDAPEAVRSDAYWLTLWYLELSILNLLGYVGPYVNRVSHRTGAGVERVPWA